MTDQTPSAVNQVERPRAASKPTLTIMVCYSRDGTFPEWPGDSAGPGDAVTGVVVWGEERMRKMRQCKTAEERLAALDASLNALFRKCPIGEDVSYE